MIILFLFYLAFIKRYPYRYSPIASLVYMGFDYLSLGFVVIGIILFKETFVEKDYLSCLISVLIVAVGVLIAVLCSNKLSAKIAEKNELNNIKTKAKYAKLFVEDHPEAYEQMIRENPDFAEKYVRDESGNIVSR